MKEKWHLTQNNTCVSELHLWFKDRLIQENDDFELHNFCSNIYESRGSPIGDFVTFETRHRELSYGFRCATGKEHRKEALAVDLLDDAAELPHSRYLITLAIAARDAGLNAGLDRGLFAKQSFGVDAAIAGRNINAQISGGWAAARSRSPI